MQYPKMMQHTHARWEQVLPDLVESKTQDISNDRTLSDHVNGNVPVSHGPEQATDTLFTPLPDHFARNFMIVDTYARGPPTSTFGFPGLPGSVIDVGPPPLTDVPEDVIAVLPEESKTAFLAMRDEARRWQSSWSTEGRDKMRAEVHITYNT